MAPKVAKITKAKPKGERKPSAYNVFMKEEIARLKKASSDLDHKAAFKKAAENWKDSPQNPKNGAAAKK